MTLALAMFLGALGAGVALAYVVTFFSGSG
jgi:hypothetical protein